MEQINTVLSSMYGKTVYIDTNVFIYFLDKNELFFSESAALLQAVNDRKIIAYTGDAVIAETMVKPYKTGDLAIITRFKDFFYRKGFLTILSHDANTFDLASQIAGQQGMKLMDAIHLASAIKAGCQYLITWDAGFKSFGGVNIVQLTDLQNPNS